MATSQTSSLSMKKKYTIIDGKIFAKTVMERVHYEANDVDGMELVAYRIRQQDLYHLGSHHADLYDEHIVEELYLDASIKYFYLKRGGDISDITAIVQGIGVFVNRELLENLFRLPSNGLKMDELETFESEELLTAHWGLFTGNESDRNVHPSYHNKKFYTPCVYLHDFCCWFIENWTGAFEMCTSLRFRMMVAIVIPRNN
ncbi:hypothetical protein OROMI_006789 [Orobanche minor]